MDLTTHDRKIFGVVDRLREREKDRSSDVGEDRQEIGDLLELTGLHKEAFAFVRKLDRKEAAKRNDVLRSLDPLLEMFQKRWDGEQTPDMLTALEGGVTVVERGDAAITPEEVTALSGEFDAALDALGGEEEDIEGEEQHDDPEEGEEPEGGDEEDEAYHRAVKLRADGQTMVSPEEVAACIDVNLGMGRRVFARLQEAGWVGNSAEPAPADEAALDEHGFGNVRPFGVAAE